MAQETRRPYNNKRNNNNNKNSFKKNTNNTKNFVKRKPSNNIKMKLIIDDTDTRLTQTVFDRINEIIENFDFSLISISVGAAKRIIKPTDANPDKINNVGYIRNYNKENKIIEVYVYDVFAEIFNTGAYSVVPKFAVDKEGNLRTITKFVIEPIYEDGEI